MMCKLFLAALTCAVLIEARSLRKRQSLAYVLPSGAEEVVGEIHTTFSCEGKIYGYYADTDNECKIFHVCLPVTFPDARSEMFTFSFFCGNQTVFDQETLVCAHPEDAIPCQDAQLFYLINENFGLDVWATTNRPVAGYSANSGRKK